MTQAYLEKDSQHLETLFDVIATTKGIVSLLDDMFINTLSLKEGNIDPQDVAEIHDFLQVIRGACRGIIADLTPISEELDERTTREYQP